MGIKEIKEQILLMADDLHDMLDFQGNSARRVSNIEKLFSAVS